MYNFSRLLILALLLICSFFESYAQMSVSSSAADLLSKVEKIQQEKKDKINAAFTAMDAVKKAGAYIESLSDLFGNGEVTLPVGIKKGEYELIIQKILYNKDTQKSQIYATCAFKFKEDGEPVAFEGIADIEGQKGLGTNGSLALIAPVRRNLGNNLSIIFDEGTKANFACDGIDSFVAKFLLLVTSDKIVPVSNDGKLTSEPIIVSFDGTFQNFDNYSMSFNFNKSFCFKGLKDIIFTLKGAILDQNDTETPALVKFPQNYVSSQGDDIKLWKGVAITNASVSLPAFFKKNQQSIDTTQVLADSLSNTSDSLKSQIDMANRLTLSFKNVIIDENGFSGEAEGQNIIISDTLDKSKWNISLNDFSLSLLKNEVVGLGFGGDINIPPFGKNSLMPYKASYNSSTEEYDFVVNVSGKFDFPVLRSTLTLDETSSVEVLVKNSDFYPTLNASGKLTINAPISKTDSTKKFSVPDISFENLRISREKPYFGVGAVGVTGELKSPKIAGFEMSVSDIQPFDSPNGSGLAFDAGVKLSEMFGGEANLQLFGDYAHWKFKEVKLDKINVDFESDVYSVKGGVWFNSGDSLYGSGFRGDVNFKIINKFDLSAVAIFGKKNDYRYFLTDVYFETSPASGITIPPALSFYGFGGGIYR